MVVNAEFKKVYLYVLLFIVYSCSYNAVFIVLHYFFVCIPRQAEVALGVPGRFRPRIFSTFGTTRMVGRQPNAHFQRLSRPQGTWFCRKEPRRKSQVTPPGIDPGTVRLVAQRS